ncbi:MAG: hypothetical protein ACUZ77_10085 [Candidatus Brocadiales bacterium]
MPDNVNNIAVQFIDVLTKWPLVVIYGSIFFRKEIKEILPKLAERLSKFGPLEFSEEMRTLAANYDPHLLRQLLLRLPPTSLSKGEPDYFEESPSEVEKEIIQEEVEEEPTVEPPEEAEFNKSFANLKRK